MPKVSRVYYHYELWEDYQNGMYRTTFNNESDLVNKAKSLLSDPGLFLETAKQVISNWQRSTAVNLSNDSTNRCAWIGQASCSYLYDVPEILTRIAWGELNYSTRSKANEVAEKIINHWTLIELSKTYGAAQLSFEF